MSPRGSISSESSNSSSKSTPSFSMRRPSGQPKSSRQQFSACGACRMRRVRCDLKDLSVATAGPSPSCSNCKERGLKCVYVFFPFYMSSLDEFAEVKAVKLLRRGRRLQQVEAIYGKISDQEATNSLNAFSRLPSIIPKLRPEFFDTHFWRWFCIQRPILDADEFAARYRDHDSVSFGLDEHGLAASEEIYEMSEKQKRDQKDRVLAMVRELFELIDHQGIMRKPSWEGLRVLLLIMPFMEEYSTIERLSVYNTALSQTHTLCTLAPVGGAALPDTRARLFWYAHLLEGISTALRGGRLALSDEDFESFQSTIPVLRFDHGTFDYVRCVPFVRRTPSSQRDLSSYPRNAYRRERHPLDRCWEEFDLLRNHTSDPQHIHDIERYIGAWQIFIFECHNIIRETLKELYTHSSNAASPILQNTSLSPVGSGISTLPLDQCHQKALRKCFKLLPAVVDIMKAHIAFSEDSSLSGSGLFKWDTSLVRDGCFFVGILAANYDETLHSKFLTEGSSVKEEDLELSAAPVVNSDEAISISLSALREMRWIMSSSDDRQATILSMYETHHQRRFQPRFDVPVPRSIDLNYRQPSTSMFSLSQPHFSTPKVVVHPASADRPLLPPLVLSNDRRIHSAPSTALSTGSDSSGWPSYTPPGTGGSGVSSHQSPFHSPHAGYKSDNIIDDSNYYQLHSEMSQFTFNPPMPSPIIVSENNSLGSEYQQRSSSGAGSLHVAPSPGGYITAGIHFPQPAQGIIHSPSLDDPRTFTDDPQCAYY
ncbi:hypothetical protein DL96DRAFT_1791982 [Flagelloscypha sp. PMI_526]|nr:hypothetical protein DL96DRAFT_1791982 [Flagelloscypha sp. PMI_526]